MKFKLHQRVKITNPDEENEALRDRTGTVVRLLMSSTDEAWINMDDDLTPELQSFPAGDSRHRHICLFEDECSVVEETK